MLRSLSVTVGHAEHEKQRAQVNFVTKRVKQSGGLPYIRFRKITALKERQSSTQQQIQYIRDTEDSPQSREVVGLPPVKQIYYGT